MLEGKIGDFSLPDIFQLITLTKKSGALNISTDQAQGRILFKGGEVCFAVADVARVAIGARLVQAGLASEEQVIGILEAKRDEGEGGNLSQALLEAAEVDEGALDAFIRSSIEDAVFDLMRLSDASFAFDATEDADATVGITVSTEHLIIEGGRRLGEWASIREHIPTDEAVLSLSPNAVADGDVTIDVEQWRVLSLIDGRRTVREIVDLSGKGEFTTTQVLSGMVTEGLIEVAAGGAEGALAELFARRDKLRRIEELELGKVAPPAVETPAPAAPASAPAPKPEPAKPLKLQASPKVELPEVPEVPEPAAPAKAEKPAEPDSEPEPAPEAPAAPEPTLETTPEVADVLPDVEAIGDDGPASPAPAPKAEEAKANGNGSANGNGHANGNGSVNGNGSAPVDRSQVARELASLGLGEGDDAAAAATPVPAPDANLPESEQLRRLTRDEDVNKGLLLRLIDGVKGA